VDEQRERTPPGDPSSIVLSYRHEHLWWDTADIAPVTWQISADVVDGSEPGDRSHVGDMNITLVDVDETGDPFALLDDQDAELGHVAGTIFDVGSGELDAELDERLEPLGNQVLILHSVRLATEWRGFGLGALLAGTAVKRLSASARAAVCYPAPLNDPADVQADDHPDGIAEQDAEWDQAVAALQRVWARLGFEHFRNGVYVLDLSLVTLDERLGPLRDAAERYRAADDR